MEKQENSIENDIYKSVFLGILNLLQQRYFIDYLSDEQIELLEK